MPVFTELPFDQTVINLSVERHLQRSPGIHLSSILKDMRITAGIERGKGKPLPEADLHLVFQQGFLWEHLVAEYISSPENQQIEMDNFVSCFGVEQLRKDAAEAGELIRPGECKMDGIALTPDGINTKFWHGEEWKATAIRRKYFNMQERRPEWLWQGMAYLRIFGMTRMVYRIWHTGDFPQQISQVIVDFTPEEIETNWNRILQHLQYMRECGRAK